MPNREERGTRAEVARHLIERAYAGMLQIGSPDNLKYQMSCDTYHPPTKTSISLTREILPILNMKAWHLSISFTDGIHGIQAYDEQSAAEWLRLVYGKWVSRVQPLPGMTNPNIRHFILPCPDDFVDLLHDR